MDTFCNTLEMGDIMKIIKFNLEELENNSNGFSCYILGRSYDLEENGVTEDFKKALKYYNEGINLNYPLQRPDSGHSSQRHEDAERQRKKQGQCKNAAGAQHACGHSIQHSGKSHKNLLRLLRFIRTIWTASGSGPYCMSDFGGSVFLCSYAAASAVASISVSISMISA